MFDHILLQKEQEDLLIEIVELVKSVPREKRHKLLVAQTLQGSSLIVPGHPGKNKAVYLGDLETLAREGLLNQSYGGRGSPAFDVTQLGFLYYEHLMKSMGSPTERIEKTINLYLEGIEFQRKYPEAFNKWAAAEDLLWQTDTDQQLTTIGHLCREAVQEFADSLIKRFNPPTVSDDKSKTVSRLRTILELKKDKLGSTEVPFLEALLSYWGTVNDLIQRQEHGAQKEDRPLTWKDGKRLVFHTAIVMFEIDQIL